MTDGPSPGQRPSSGDGPEVFVADEQDLVAVDAGHLTRLAEDVLRAQGIRVPSELAVYFVDETVISDLNERFMGEEGPTDVIAFPIDDDSGEGGRSPDAGTKGPDRGPADASEIPLLLGDVFICPSVAARNAGEHGTTAEDELALLVVHGILHVLGMDHADAEEAEAMQSRERDLLAQFHLRS